MLRSIRLVGEIQAVELADGTLRVTMGDQTMEFPVSEAPVTAPQAPAPRPRRPKQTNGHASPGASPDGPEAGQSLDLAQ